MMFRPMRRANKQISTEAAGEVLRSARYGFLAVNGDDGYPYTVPVNFLYEPETNRIWFHGSGAGHKADALKACDKVCFTVCGEETVKAEAWAPFVQSVVMFGRCAPVKDREEALSVLRRLAAKYYPDQAQAEEEITQYGKGVQIFEITVEHLSGKEIQEK